MVIGLKKRALEKLAYRIWLKRKKRGELDADDSRKNWNLAKKLLKKWKERYKNLC